MDFFGIGAAMIGGARMYFTAARGTGRTGNLIAVLKTGDRVVFKEAREGKRVERLLQEKGIKIQWVVVDPKRPDKLYELGRSRGRTFLDHSWIEAFYIEAIYDARNYMLNMELRSSGSVEKVKVSKHASMEMSKFETWKR